MKESTRIRLNVAIILGLFIVVSHATKSDSYNNCMSHQLTTQAAEVSKELEIVFDKKCKEAGYLAQHEVRENRREAFKMALTLLKKAKRDGKVANWKKRVIIHDLNAIYADRIYLKFKLIAK